MNRIFILFFCLISALSLHSAVQANYSSYNLDSETEHYQSDVDLLIGQDSMSYEENEEDRFENCVLFQNANNLFSRRNVIYYAGQPSAKFYRSNSVLIFYTNLPPPFFA